MGVEPIKRLVVDAHLPFAMGEGVVVTWVLDELFPCDRRPLLHTILVGDSPTAHFQKLGTVEDGTEYLDTQKRTLTKALDVWYAVMTVDQLDNKFYTPPQRVGSVWRKREWLIAREAVRQAKVRLINRRGGTRGFLLRRRANGTPCRTCTDPDTGKITLPDCPACYGTGITGGYYPPIECYVDPSPEQLLIKLDPSQGLISAKTSVWGVLAYPPFHPNDYWVDANSGLRYRIGEQVATTAHIENIPIFQQVQAEAEHLKHVIYTYPVSCS